MMSIILYLFGLNKMPKSSGPREITKSNRFQNQAPINDLPQHQVPPHHMFGEVLTDFRVQSCLTLVQEEELETIGDGNNDVVNVRASQDLNERKQEHQQISSEFQSRTIEQAHKHPPQVQHDINIDTNLPYRRPSNYSISIYSSEEIYPTENMESLRRRAKTPVFFVGQLERKAMEHDPSECLAHDYQTVLPQRNTASYLDLNIPLNPAKRRLRKVKSQESLRDLCRSFSSSPSIASDCETLVGSEGGSSPRGSICKEDLNDDSFGFKNVTSPADEPPEKTSALDQDISLQICSDLLASRLATTLHQGCTPDKDSRISSLEILFMIEAYESIRKELQSSPRDIHVTRAAQTALDQWIQALYTIYEDCHGI